jgi:hypothetical protein
MCEQAFDRDGLQPHENANVRRKSCFVGKKENVKTSRLKGIGVQAPICDDLLLSRS